MSQVINTLPTQGTQHIISAMKSVIYGLRRSVNHYDILVTYTGAGAQTGQAFTQSHKLSKKEVSRIDLCANHCAIIFKPSLQRDVLFLPYDVIKNVSHCKMVDLDFMYLYRTEQPKGHASRG